MPVSDKERRSYLKKVEKNLVCSRKDKKRILKDLNENIDDVLMDKPQIDFKRLEWEIGTPEEVAQKLLENTSSEIIKKKISLVRVVTLFCLTVIALFGLFLFSLWLDAHESHYGNSGEIKLYEEVDGTAVLIETVTEMYD